MAPVWILFSKTRTLGIRGYDRFQRYIFYTLTLSIMKYSTMLIICMSHTIVRNNDPTQHSSMGSGFTIYASAIISHYISIITLVLMQTVFTSDN